MAIGSLESAQYSKFVEFARNIISDLGDAIRPYLKAIYNGARDLPGMEDIPSGASPEELAVLAAIAETGEASLERLKECTDMDTGSLLSALMKLELKLIVERGADQLYRRVGGK